MVAEVWKCSVWANFVFVLWRQEHENSSEFHHFLSAPAKRPKPHDVAAREDWPASVGNAWVQAKKSQLAGAWDAAATMARKSVQAAARELGAKGNSIKAEIDDLTTRGLLPPSIAEWAHHVRDLGATGAHDEGQPCTKEEAKEACDFAYYVAEYLFALPKAIEKARAKHAQR